MKEKNSKGVGSGKKKNKIHVEEMGDMGKKNHIEEMGGKGKEQSHEE
jgi:hypothetical protein